MNLTEYKKIRATFTSKEERVTYWLSLPEDERKKLSKAMKASILRKEKDSVMESCGLTKVYGAVSGKVYWE
jgi:hypothetical protein